MRNKKKITKKMNAYTRLRLEVGLSASALSKISGLGSGTYKSIEHGYQRPTARTLLKIFTGLHEAGMKNLTFEGMLNQIEKYPGEPYYYVRKSYGKNQWKEPENKKYLPAARQAGLLK